MPSLEKFIFGPFELDPSTGDFRKDGQLVKLDPQAARLLALLLTQPGVLVSYQEMQSHLWGDQTHVDYSGGIRRCVAQIRAALGDSRPYIYVETARQRGCRFLATVTKSSVLPQSEGPREHLVNQNPVTSIAASDQHPVLSEAAAGNHATRVPSARISRQRRFWVSISLMALATSGGIWMALVSGHRQLVAAMPQTLPARRLLAVASTEGHKSLRINTGHTNPELIITPDGRKLYAIAHEEGFVTVIDLRTLEVTRTIMLPQPANHQVMAPDGDRVYIAAKPPDGQVMVLDTRSDRIVETIRTDVPTFGVAASPDRKKLFLAMGYAGLQVIDMETRRVRSIAPSACPLYLAMSPTGTSLFVSYQCGGPGGRAGHDTVDIYDVGSEHSVGRITGLPLVGGAHGRFRARGSHFVGRSRRVLVPGLRS